MKYSACSRCGNRIHYEPALPAWIDGNADLCREARYVPVPHIPGEDMKYSEAEIREACRKEGNIGGRTPHRIGANIEEELIRRLKKDDHAHDFTDADTVTVKELRESHARGNRFLDSLLEDISKHRKPQYKPGKVYRTANGIYLMREGGSGTPPEAAKGWWMFGSNTRIVVTQPDWLPLEEMP